MGEQISNSEVNPTIILILGIFSFPAFWLLIGPIVNFVVTFAVMKAGQPRAIGCAVWSLVPILSLIIAIDNWKVSQKLANGETVDEMHHEIEFLGNLPLLQQH